MILNKQPEPPPAPTAAPPPSIVSRAWLESADGTVAVLRWIGHIVVLGLGTLSVAGSFGHWQAWYVVAAIGATVATWEIATIAVRALIAIAWAARKPDAA
jgi:hypothetical protein